MVPLGQHSAWRLLGAPLLPEHHLLMMSSGTGSAAANNHFIKRIY